MNAMNVVACVIAFVLASATSGEAETARVTMNKIDDNGIGAAMGTIELRDTKKGLQILPNVKGLPPGQHGIHVHVNANCGPAEQNGKMTAGMGAGGHFDPLKTGKHLGPMSMEGHKGDLPALVVNGLGEARSSMLAPHLKVGDVRGHAIMVHAGGDNYSDQPAPLGGGGARIACGTL
jgi:superoxide dismutase, Cu-Zn family